MMRLKGFQSTGRASALAIGLAMGGALLPAAMLNAAPARVTSAPGQPILLAVGASRIVDLSGTMSDVVVANPAVADVVVRSNRQFTIVAKGPGETNVFATAPNGKILYSTTIRVGNNITSIDQMLKMAMPDADISVATMNGMVLLTGIIGAPDDAAEAERLTQVYVGKDVTVVSRLRTATPMQVNLQVRIAEVNKTLAKNIGFNLATIDGTGGFKFGLGQGRGAINQTWTVDGPLGVGNGLLPVVSPVTEKTIGSAISSLSSGATLGAETSLFGLDILGALDLAETQGLSTTLANPNLTALSGETASFLAGGEIPIPLSTGLGATTVEYKQYGVSLAFTPTVLADGRISMRVRPEVSQLDASAGVRLNNITIPGVSTRRAETTVELGSGQSFMIGGLLSSSRSNSLDKAPFLGDLPILGNLFKSRGWRKQETELVIVITPYLVKPVNAKDIALPTDGYRNATDAQQIFGNQIHSGKTGGKRPTPDMAPPVTVTPDQLPGRRGADAADAPRKGKGKTKRTAAADAAPGFSF